MNHDYETGVAFSESVMKNRLKAMAYGEIYFNSSKLFLQVERRLLKFVTVYRAILQDKTTKFDGRRQGLYVCVFIFVKLDPF